MQHCLLLLNVEHCIYYCGGLSVASETQLSLLPALFIYFKTIGGGGEEEEKRKIKERKSMQGK